MSPRECYKLRTGFLEKLWNLHLWRYMALDWTWPWGTCTNVKADPALRRELYQTTSQGSFQPKCFCDSKMFPPHPLAFSPPCAQNFGVLQRKLDGSRDQISLQDRTTWQGCLVPFTWIPPMGPCSPPSSSSSSLFVQSLYGLIKPNQKAITIPVNSLWNSLLILFSTSRFVSLVLQSITKQNENFF